MAKQNFFQQPLLESLVSHGPSEIILMLIAAQGRFIFIISVLSTFFFFLLIFFSGFFYKYKWILSFNNNALNWSTSLICFWKVKKKILTPRFWTVYVISNEYNG